MCLFLHLIKNSIYLILKKPYLIIMFFSLIIVPLKIAGQINQENKKISSYSAFKNSEWLQFRFHYGIFNASYASLTLSSDIVNNEPVIHAKGYGRTSGLARLFFRVEDHYESYFNLSLIHI